MGKNIALVIQDVQSVDVYKYYKSLDYNKNDFVSIMPNDLKELAEIIIFICNYNLFHSIFTPLLKQL